MAQPDMPDQEIALGKAAEDPNAPAAAPDMNRYYYPPGKTEPELRPEFANEAAASPEQTNAATGEQADDSDESKPKRGKLPDDFPHVELLRAAGVSTYAQARNLKGDYGSVDGIAETRGAEIDHALAE